MYRPELESHFAKAIFRLFTVCPAIVKGMWNEHNANSLADEIPDLSLGMVEVPGAV
jgi:hypothetical protein